MSATYSETDSSGTRVWDVTTLWELAKDLRVQRVPTSSLQSALDSECWFCDEDRPTVRAVIKHAHRISQADLSYPILLSKDGQVMDGMHRLAKAFMDGLDEISVVRFDEDPEPDHTS